MLSSFPLPTAFFGNNFKTQWFGFLYQSPFFIKKQHHLNTRPCFFFRGKINSFAWENRFQSQDYLHLRPDQCQASRHLARCGGMIPLEINRLPHRNLVIGQKHKKHRGNERVWIIELKDTFGQNFEIPRPIFNLSNFSLTNSKVPPNIYFATHEAQLINIFLPTFVWNHNYCYCLFSTPCEENSSSLHF